MLAVQRPRASQDPHHQPTIIDIRQNSPTQIAPFYFSRSDSNNNMFKSPGNAKVGVVPRQGLKDQSTAELRNPPVRTTQTSGSVQTDGNLKLANSIIKGLTPGQGQIKQIPTLVLYDDKGLQIYDEITYLEEYYLVQEEIDILERDSERIVDLIPDNSVVVELGSGSLRKTRLLLDALENKRQNIRYYALDLMRDELTKSLVSLRGYKNVTTAGLWGTYDEGMAFISSFPPEVPKTILWLGSSIGNMTRAEAREFISNYRQSLNVGDSWLIGIDRRNSPAEIALAYNDSLSVTRDFIMNGLDHVNLILQQLMFDRSKFNYFGRYDEEIGRHEAYYKTLVAHELNYTQPDGTTLQIRLEKDELINVEYSYKWSLEESAQLFNETKMAKVGHWASPRQRYDLHMLRKEPFFLSSNLPMPIANLPMPSTATPSKDQWVELWGAWNLVTIGMIRHPGMLLEKPIDLRHPFIFYIGHIPTFLDIQLAKVCKEPFTEPAHFTQIFERGIDPDVDDPSKCHEHSDVPDTWPDVAEIIAYRDRVVNRLYRVLGDPVRYPMTRRSARILFMAFEHQAMHLETILYMLVQSPNTKPPPGIRNPWDGEAATCAKIQKPTSPATWITINPKELRPEILSLGHDDLETADEAEAADLDTPFGWDNEHPRVAPPEIPEAFQIQTRQVTNGEYLTFLEATTNKQVNVKGDQQLPSAREVFNVVAKEKMKIPKSWVCEEKNIFVRTVFGNVGMSVASSWPVCCSQKEALAYMAWIDPEGKTLSLPTEHQLSIAFKLKEGGINGFLNCNYGFRAWYPLPSLAAHPVTSSVWDSFQGPGALWDWTSTPFGPLGKAWVTSQIYPGYSSDFFDGKHCVVLGASWSTHPRIAARRSFRNWYQGNYEYAFIGFRLVRNVGGNQINK